MKYDGRNVRPEVERIFRMEDEHDQDEAEKIREDAKRKLRANPVYAVCPLGGSSRDYFWVAWRSGEEWRDNSQPTWQGRARKRELAVEAALRSMAGLGFPTQVNASSAAGWMPK